MFFCLPLQYRQESVIWKNMDLLPDTMRFSFSGFFPALEKRIDVLFHTVLHSMQHSEKQISSGVEQSIKSFFVIYSTFLTSFLTSLLYHHPILCSPSLSIAFIFFSDRAATIS